MLQCQNLRAGYDGAEVLHGLDFALPEGGNLVVLGPNGAGKSTLLKCVAGLLPFEGRVRAAGLEIGQARRASIAKNIAILSQFSHAVYPYTVWEVVMMGRYVHQKGAFFHSAGERDIACVQETLRAMNLEDLAARPVTTLSGGQLQRVFLAQVLAQEPRLILLDEPTSHLDLRVQADMLAHLKEWSAAGGRSVVGVLHDINLSLQFASHVLLLKDGCAAAFGRVEDVVRPALLRDVYGLDVAAYMLESLGRWQKIAAQED